MRRRDKGRQEAITKRERKGEIQENESRREGDWERKIFPTRLEDTIQSHKIRQTTAQSISAFERSLTLCRV